MQKCHAHSPVCAGRGVLPAADGPACSRITLQDYTCLQHSGEAASSARHRSRIQGSDSVMLVVALLGRLPVPWCHDVSTKRPYETVACLPPVAHRAADYIVLCGNCNASAVYTCVKRCSTTPLTTMHYSARSLTQYLASQLSTCNSCSQSYERI